MRDECYGFFVSGYWLGCSINKKKLLHFLRNTATAFESSLEHRPEIIALRGKMTAERSHYVS